MVSGLLLAIREVDEVIHLQKEIWMRDFAKWWDTGRMIPVQLGSNAFRLKAGPSFGMVMEYKPSHKLSVFNLRAGLLRADNELMNIREDVINRITTPTDPEGKFVYHSEQLTAAALMQTYGYMIENGLEYSKLATGEADVFLQIKEDEPHTLYYHLAEPKIEAEAESEIDVLLCRTAVGQSLTFCLMALDSGPRSQKWRNYALETAYKAVIDHEQSYDKYLLKRRP